MKVLVCGGRAYHDVDTLHGVLDGLKTRYPDMSVIHGAAYGADTLAGKWAAANDVPCVAFPANWAAYGPKAGPVRNGEMLLRGKPDLVVAFPSPGQENRGSNNMIEQARRASVRVVVVQP